MFLPKSDHLCAFGFRDESSVPENLTHANQERRIPAPEVQPSDLAAGENDD